MIGNICASEENCDNDDGDNDDGDNDGADNDDADNDDGDNDDGDNDDNDNDDGDDGHLAAQTTEQERRRWRRRVRERGGDRLSGDFNGRSGREFCVLSEERMLDVGTGMKKMMHRFWVGIIALE